MSQPNPTTPVDVAEGERLLAEVASLPWRTAATDDTCVVDADNEEVCALAGNYGSQDEWPQMEARAALIVFAVNHLPALLRAASERDAAVREVEAMKRLLAELADNLETTTQDSFLRGGGWQGSEDCLGIERARAALASAAQGGAKSVDATEGRLGGAK